MSVATAAARVRSWARRYQPVGAEVGSGPSAAEDPSDRSGLVKLSLLSAICGVAVGMVGAAFSWLLLRADLARVSLVEWAHHSPVAGWLVPVALVASGAAAARFVVRLVPLASGSGVHTLEAAWRGEIGPPSWLVLPAKFVGGLLAIGSGLVLGREGPTVHMGAVIGSEAGRRVGVRSDDQRVLEAALGGAGLAVAFNAPLGGSLFVFEEVARSFRFRLTLCTLIGSGVAIATSRLFLANQPDFVVGPVATPPGRLLVVYLAFGALTGALGVAYNRMIVGGVDLFARTRRPSAELRAAAVGAVVGIVLWFFPTVGGDGIHLTQRVLGGAVGVSALVGYFLLRVVIGPFSYSPGAPGGLFAPLLALGAIWGMLAYRLIEPVVPLLHAHPTSLAIVGMTALFAAVVRAPLTGIALVAEMTATTTLLVPMFVACFAAILMATLLGNEPIYDSLRARIRGGTRP
jgi:CIC family chloride channel protein